MNKEAFGNNQVTISGSICGDAKFSHDLYGEKFYVVEVAVQRLSGVSDFIPVMVSDRMCNVMDLTVDQRISVYGQFRSYNRHEDGKNRLVLSVFARELEILDDMQSGREGNEIILYGYICKEPVYRKTPHGREIADMLIAVNRSYGKSDYIPCICWGRNARYASFIGVGTHVRISGRIQSREYMKKISETEFDNRVAYEVSVCKIELFDEE